MRAVRMMSEGLRPVSAALLCPSWLASGADRGVDAAVQDHPADSAHACAFRQGPVSYTHLTLPTTPYV